MKKILFICKYLSTSKNGFESRLSTLINLFNKNNYEVLAITSSNSLKKFKFKKKYTLKKIDNVKYYFIKDTSDYKLYSLQRILSWIKFEFDLFNFNFKKFPFKPDIIYISSLSLLSILNGIYLKKKFNAKLVFEMRDFWPYFLYTTGKFSRFNPFVIFLGIIEKYGIYQSDLIVSLIPKIKEYLKYRGFYKKKTFASTFPLNKKFFIITKNNRINLDNKYFHICYAGNFGFDNYLDILLNLISKTRNELFMFHFFGDGSQKETLKKKFSHLNNVKFYKHVNYSDLHSILIKMDCLIVSFGFNDKFPLFGYELNKLNNYLMASKPIIVVGKKINLNKDRGEFIFVTKNNPLIFEKKLISTKLRYNFFKKISKKNKKKLLIRNNPKLIFKQTETHLKNL
tara:strand:- start:12448 stop:13638 length:1191 start_codon:yes stop_codon:yes gene_type:complete